LNLVAKCIDKSKFAIDYIILNEGDPMISFLSQINVPCTVASYQDYSNTPEIVKFIYEHLKGMIEDGIPDDKITIIPTGFDLSEFENVDSSRIDKLRSKYLANHHGPVIGVAARYVRWKGVEYVIEAHKQVLEAYPNAILVLSGTHTNRANLEEQIRNARKEDIVAPQYEEIISITDKLAQLPEHSYIEIPFEEDLFALFRLFDIFVHVPTDSIQETFGQVYVEAMLSRVPSVITLAGSALDHAVHKENAWVVDYKNSAQIAQGILALLSDSCLRETIVNNAFLCAQRYDIKNHIQQLEDFYVCELEKRRK
jgi:glycosyltransferase involved in cell wall biosynthesis